jgi:hypothetical protein
LGGNHNYEKPSPSFSVANRFNFYFLFCKRDLKIKTFASRAGKKGSRHTICKTFRSGSTKEELGFTGLRKVIMRPASALCSSSVAACPDLSGSHTYTFACLFAFLISRKTARVKYKRRKVFLGVFAYLSIFAQNIMTDYVQLPPLQRA